MNATVKRGTTPTLPIKINIEDMSQIASINFLFKQQMTDTGEPGVMKTYPSESVVYEGGIFYVEFTDEETREFRADSTIYLDVKPITTNGKILATKIVPINMYATLYPEDEEGDG